MADLHADKGPHDIPNETSHETPRETLRETLNEALRTLCIALYEHARQELRDWLRFGPLHHLALLLNALLLMLVLLFAAANSIFELKFGVMIALAGGSAPAISLCGLWWCRHWRAARVLMLLANLAAGGFAFGWVLPWFLLESLPGVPGGRYWFPFDVAATLLFTSAPASALWVQARQRRRPRA